MSAPVVLHVIPSLAAGGAEHMLARLVVATRQQGTAPVVANLGRDGELTTTIRAADIPVHEFGLTTPMLAPIAIWRLARLMQRLRPVAIQSWLYYADLLSLWALEFSGIADRTRLYWGVRCSEIDMSHYRPALRWTIAACAKRSRRPDAVVANSFAGRSAHLSLGYTPRAFPVIPNGIDTDRFRPNPAARAIIRAELGLMADQAVVIHAARVDAMKDHDTLLAVARALPDVRFLAVGAGTRALPARPNVIALGHRGDMPALFAAADVALSTSAFGEGFPNVVAEAMASGVPVVATDVGDTRRIVGDTGMIAPPRDAAALAQAVRRLIGEPGDERRRRAQASRARIEANFSMDRVVAAFQALHLTGDLPPESSD